MLKYMLFMLLFTTQIYSNDYVKLSAKGLIDSGFLWSKKLVEKSLIYSVTNTKLEDKEEKFYTISYNQANDYILFFRYFDMKLFLEFIDIYHLERENLERDKQDISFYLGKFNISYLEESVGGLGKQIVDIPQVNLSIHYRKNNFYFQFSPLEAFTRKGVSISLDSLYFSDEQLSVLIKFFQEQMNQELN